jgi:lactate dehydrogenase-like 2-hydroxyacid dehydrogenase
MSAPRILLTRRWPAQVERHLVERYEVTVNPDDIPLSANGLAEGMRSHDVVCPTVTDRITAEILEAGRGRCRMLANFGVGVSHIDLDACRRLGVTVSNTPDVLTESTADVAILLMLMVARRAGEGERQVRAGAWPGWAPTAHLGSDVTGKTLGLIGFGRIGQAAARKAHRGFGMQILYHSRRQAPPEAVGLLGARYCATVDELLRQADFVSLHCPGGAGTRHLLDARRLALMKPGAFLINTARGEIIDENALIEVLRRQRIGGAGLDVYEHEPRVPAGLAALENVVLLPHLGSASVETRVAMGMRVVENLECFLADLVPPDRVP